MFKGIITPIITPFNRDEIQTINYEATTQLIEHLISKGVDGIFILGSNGEFHVINKEEKLKLAKHVVEVVNGRVPVFAGTGACSTKEAIELSKGMEELGVDALSVINPYFIPPTEEEIIDHFTKIADSVSIPIVLYNIPKLTGTNLSKNTVKTLMQHKNIVSIKDSSGNLDNVKDYVEACGNNGTVLIGSDSKISEGYALGAAGAIAGTSNVITEVVVGLNKALNDNDTSKAQEYQQQIEKIRSVLPLGTVPSIMKRSVELAGIADVGPARFPVSETTQDDDIKIKEMLSFYNLI